MSTKIRKVIWTEIVIDMDAFEEYWINNDYEKIYPDYTSADKFDWAVMDNCYILNDIYAETWHDDTDGKILCIYDMFMADGTKKHGYNELGKCLAYCFYEPECKKEFYIADGDFKARSVHDTCMDFYTFRERRENISDSDWDEFLNAVSCGTETVEQIEKYTKSLAEMANDVWESHGFYMAGNEFVYKEHEGYDHSKPEHFYYMYTHEIIENAELI